jgi:hypothetical protein
MARIQLSSVVPNRMIVTLSRRNLLTLLHRLDVPGEIRGRDSYLDGVPIDFTVILRAEEDEPHYARRIAMFGESAAAGSLRDHTKAFVDEHTDVEWPTPDDLTDE